MAWGFYRDTSSAEAISAPRTVVLWAAIGLGAVWGVALATWQGAALGETRAPLFGFGLTLTALAAVDVAALRLPDALTLPLIAAGLVVCGMEQPGALPEHVLAAAGAFGALAGLAAGYKALRGRDGLGLGDAKLLAAGGAWLGWRPLPLAVLIACGLAFAWFAWRLAREGRRGLQGPLAFGAPLCAALWLAALYAPG